MNAALIVVLLHCRRLTPSASENLVYHLLAVLHFSKQARTKKAGAADLAVWDRYRPSSIFTPDMLVGEAKELFSERIERWTPKISRKKYLFQIRNDDGRDHFTEISRRFTTLWFVLVNGIDDQYGSYLIRQGRCRGYSVPDKLQDAVMNKHGVPDLVEGYIEDDEDDWRFWEASWELMDLAQAHWDGFLLKHLSPGRGVSIRKDAKSSKRRHSTK